MRRIGFKWSPQLVRRTQLEVAGTVLAAQLALTHGLACHLGGGTHHAHRSFGSGFTILNDLAVAAAHVTRYAAAERRAERVLIVDLDVHQGDGTASIFQEEPAVFTMSFHCGKNFPFRKSTSDLDVDVAPGTADDEYMALLGEHLPRVLDEHRPQLVLYDAGIDAYAGDELGYLELSEAGLYARDAYVLRECAKRGMPCATVIGGGYDKDLRALANRHAIVFRAAKEIWDTMHC